MWGGLEKPTRKSRTNTRRISDYEPLKNEREAHRTAGFQEEERLENAHCKEKLSIKNTYHRKRTQEDDTAWSTTAGQSNNYQETKPYPDVHYSNVGEGRKNDL